MRIWVFLRELLLERPCSKATALRRRHSSVSADAGSATLARRFGSGVALGSSSAVSGRSARARRNRSRSDTSCFAAMRGEIDRDRDPADSPSAARRRPGRQRHDRQERDVGRAIRAEIGQLRGRECRSSSRAPRRMGRRAGTPASSSPSTAARTPSCSARTSAKRRHSGNPSRPVAKYIVLRRANLKLAEQIGANESTSGDRRRPVFQHGRRHLR